VDKLGNIPDGGGWRYVGREPAAFSVQGISMHTASHLQACRLTMHTVQAFVVRDYLD
jgi:hypothetical protein